MDAIVQAHDGKVQMIDSSIVRVHQHASGVPIPAISISRSDASRSSVPGDPDQCGGA
jgi:hypothetical protein